MVKVEAHRATINTTHCRMAKRTIKTNKCNIMNTIGGSCCSPGGGGKTNYSEYGSTLREATYIYIDLTSVMLIDALRI